LAKVLTYKQSFPITSYLCPGCKTGFILAGVFITFKVVASFNFDMEINSRATTQA